MEYLSSFHSQSLIFLKHKFYFIFTADAMKIIGNSCHTAENLKISFVVHSALFIPGTPKQPEMRKKFAYFLRFRKNSVRTLGKEYTIATSSIREK